MIVVLNTLQLAAYVLLGLAYIVITFSIGHMYGWDANTKARNKGFKEWLNQNNFEKAVTGKKV